MSTCKLTSGQQLIFCCFLNRPDIKKTSQGYLRSKHVGRPCSSSVALANSRRCACLPLCELVRLGLDLHLYEAPHVSTADWNSKLAEHADMRMQVDISVPKIEVVNVGGRTEGYEPGEPANGEYALDIQVNLTRAGYCRLRSADLQSIALRRGPSLSAFGVAGMLVS